MQKNSGGGVFLFREGDTGTLNFSLGKGKISNNTADVNGGGVEIDEAYNTSRTTTFNMSDGEISDNTAKGNGGGINMSTGKFDIIGGKISGNKAGQEGGGVYYYNSYSGSSQSTMSGGEISGNEAKNGGGVSYYTSVALHLKIYNRI